MTACPRALALAAMLAVGVVRPVGAAPVVDINPAVERAGDLMQFGIPLAALGLTFLLDDAGASDAQGAGFSAGSRLGLDVDWLSMNGSPRHDLALALARTELATYTLKYGIDAERPNGGGQSFPSGHTSVAFAGAEFVRKQYGWWWGAPAYLAAGYVGWSRVETRNHWTRDVLAGAAIGVLSNHDMIGFSIPFGRLTVAPSMFTAAPALGLDGLDPGADAALGLARPGLVPGLRLEFRF